MENDIEKILVNYRNSTFDIIGMLKKNDFDAVNEEIKKRQVILNKIISMPDKKDETKAMYEKLKIRETENEAAELMGSKLCEIKAKLSNISKNRVASSAYVNIGKSAKIFSKKI